VFTAAEGRLDAERLQALAPDFALRDTLLCGPEDFMGWIAAFYREQGLSRQLKQEHFQARRTEIRPDAERFAVHAPDGSTLFHALNGQPLLEAAEAGGLSPVHGCRRGICKTCTCRKLGGTVHNRLTDTLSGSGEEWIQLCVSTPVSDIHLEL
jgi:ferredoxin